MHKVVFLKTQKTYPFLCYFGIFIIMLTIGIALYHWFNIKSSHEVPIMYSDNLSVKQGAREQSVDKLSDKNLQQIYGSSKQNTIRKRHLRGTWIATVTNLDWPTKQSLAILDQTERIKTQKNELISMLDEAVSMGINAVFFQVKPTSDAFYRSNILPWSSYLTGTLGQDPGYDPLQFIIEQAHQRNLELHAWFNPYRVSMDTEHSTIEALKNVPTGSPKSVYVVHPDWIGVAYNRFVIDPGIPDVRKWVIDGVMEVVEKYDIDAIHFDDYFYYETPDSKLNDDATFASYGNGFANKGDWRRNNTLLLITELSEAIRSVKPHVKFGISPSGVWRNKIDDPIGSDTSAGSPHYDTYYADTRLWILKELIDYVAPQVYWPFTRKIVQFDIITQWWSNVVQGKNVHLYIGEALYKVGVPSSTEPEWVVDNGASEIKKQLLWNIDMATIQGSILFHQSSLNEPVVLHAREVIKKEVWPSIALIPSMPWKGNISPRAPSNLTQIVTPEGIRLQWEDGGDDSSTTVYYAIYRFTDGKPADINCADCLLSTVRRKIGKQQIWLDNSMKNNYKGLLYGVTALSRNHDESDVCTSIHSKP
ncbi:glycoside hydrolase family 10 protein [Candidatus Tisiphia endosymbiont of Hybos culiciformis]|uniref:glycoside hydrolase family 10 protein n=1 Tax=Candidatus Tisiphia endosymbiont of Hybos culiciformis TaxID=3139331 RepID=UPI003CCAA460